MIYEVNHGQVMGELCRCSKIADARDLFAVANILLLFSMHCDALLTCSLYVNYASLYVGMCVLKV